MRTKLHKVAVSAALLACSACTLSHRPGAPLVRSGDEIVVCGQLFHTGTPVVLWLDPRGYDAYRVEKRFASSQPASTQPLTSGPSDGSARYGSVRKHVPPPVAEEIRNDGWRLARLQESIDLFVIHYDVCGTSRQCFKVLHDIRGLSVHFMLDLDGTIYQTLDLKERAWHAGDGNDRSVGIEIANIGAYPTPAPLDKWYGRDPSGRPVVMLPASYGDGGLRVPEFIARPARPELVAGRIHDQDLVQYDLTNEQYAALIKLTAALCRVLPRIRADYPRDSSGKLNTTVLRPDELAAYSGLIGHYHLTRQKIDPGPAFDWNRLVAGVNRELRW